MRDDLSIFVEHEFESTCIFVEITSGGKHTVSEEVYRVPGTD